MWIPTRVAHFLTTCNDDDDDGGDGVGDGGDGGDGDDGDGGDGGGVYDDDDEPVPQ